MRLILFVLFLLAALPVAASAPLRYQIDAVVRSSAPGNLLANAALQLNISWDATAFPPDFSGNGLTAWPVGNATGSLAVAGSANADGTYGLEFPIREKINWFANSRSLPYPDYFRFPSMSFHINGEKFTTGLLYVFLKDSYFSDSNPSNLKVFGNSEARWGDLPISGTKALIISGSATLVPEPATLTTISFAFLSLAALRRSQR